MLLLQASLALGLLGQAVDAPPVRMADGRNTAAERLESMKASMKGYKFVREGDRLSAVERQAEPAFRSGSQKENNRDGAVFLWVDEVGRPQASIQAFMLTERDRPDGKWYHEFVSLSTSPLVASKDGRRCWHPDGPGVEFRPVADAPKPAASPAARLRQMRAIADDFRADDDFRETGWVPLRLLTTPVVRYGKPGGLPEDGAVFAFAEGTDPEVFLFVESRAGKDGPEWQYALAPMGCWAVKVKLKGREVWSLPRRSTGDPNQPIYTYQVWP